MKKKPSKYYTLHWREIKRPGNTDSIRGRFAGDVADLLLAKANHQFPRFLHWKEEIEQPVAQ